MDASEPPGSNLRADIFLLRAVSACAVGAACTRDDSPCFYLRDESGNPTGTRVALGDNSLRFVPPDDPSTKNAEAIACFRMVMDDQALAKTKQLFSQLRTDVFRASGGDINLALEFHELPPLNAPFYPFGSGPFLDPRGLETQGLPLLSRETDFVFAVTGYEDPDTGIGPRLDHCVGTNWPRNGNWAPAGHGILGGSPFSWLALERDCADSLTFLSTWMVQLYFARRDLNGLPEIYARPDCDEGRCYPACGSADPDPTQWFPRAGMCTTDPDAPACGQGTRCPDLAAYYAHVLSRHWVHGRPFNGNHCADGKMDFDETGIDTGGVCDRLPP